MVQNHVSNLKLSECPPDIAFEIISHLYLADVLCLLSVCSSFRTLSESRHLWISVLEQTQKRRALACPVGTHLSGLDLDDLRRIAYLTNQVERNWNHESPCISHAHKYVYPPIRQPGIILSIVPGIGVAILYTPDEGGQIICCDTTGLVPTVSISVGHVYDWAHYDDYGRHLLAVVTVPSNDQLQKGLYVIALTYGDGKTPDMREIFHTQLGTVMSLFICKDVVGVIPYPSRQPSFMVHAINFVTNTRVDVNVQVEQSIYANLFCSVIDDTPYFIIDQHDVYTCPAAILPYGIDSKLENATSLQRKLNPGRVHDSNMDKYVAAYDYRSASLGLSPWGLRATFVLCHRLRRPSYDTLTRLCPIDDPLTMQPGTASELVLKGRIWRYQLSLNAPLLITSDTHGTYTAVILDISYATSIDNLQLHLIRYTQDSPGITSCRLTVPSGIDLGRIFSIRIDERFGIIYLSQDRGHLLALPYA